MPSNESSPVASPAKTGDLEGALRDAVRDVYKKGNLEELTVKRIRKSVEVSLGLEQDFFREVQWKDKSKSIIEAEAVS